MKKILVGLFIALALCNPANAQKSKAALQTEINTSWPDNNNNLITPKALRGPPQDIVNSYLDLGGASSFVCPGGQAIVSFSNLSTPVCAPVGGTTSLAVGVTPITGGVSGRLLWDNGGVVGEIATTGTNIVVLNNGPTLTNPIFSTTSPTAAATLGFNTAGGPPNYGDGTINHTLATVDTSQTLSSKVLASPRITGAAQFVGSSSGTVNVQAAATASGTLTFPSVTGVLVADTAAQTLTNKSMDGGNNTFTNIGTGSLSGLGTGVATALGTATNTSGGFVTQAVANSSLATMAANTVKANGTAGTATPTDISCPTGGVVGRNGSSNVNCQLVVDANVFSGAAIATSKIAFGTNVAAAAANTLNASGGLVGFSGALGTPTQLTLTNATGLVASTGTTATGTPSSTTFLRGDNTWATPAGAGTVTSVTGNGVTITGSGTIPPPYGIVNHSLSASASAGALTINLLDNAGSTPSATSPVNGYFRNVTAATGSWTQLTVNAALSITLPASSTLGVTSSTGFRLWVVLFNDAGTARLGVINCSTTTNIFPLIETQPVSSTAVSAASTSAGVFYTGVAVTTKSYLIVGYVDWASTGITAGTWTTTNLQYIQSFGPGIRKPGEPTGNIVVANNFNGSSTTSTTMVDVSGSSVTITPTSAANKIKAQASGYGQVLAAGSGQNSTYSVQLVRTATVISGPSTTGVVSGAGTNQQSNGGFALYALDSPNTNLSTTYKLQNDTSNAAGAAQTFGATITVEEIQG